MIKVSILYPKKPDSHFDAVYYTNCTCRWLRGCLLPRCWLSQLK